MHCAKGDFPHSQYAFYLHAIDAQCKQHLYKLCLVTEITVPFHI